MRPAKSGWHDTAVLKILTKEWLPTKDRPEEHPIQKDISSGPFFRQPPPLDRGTGLRRQDPPTENCTAVRVRRSRTHTTRMAGVAIIPEGRTR